MPDDHTVTSSAEAHKIMMCAVGSAPTRLGDTSGVVMGRAEAHKIIISVVPSYGAI
jgi:hypothetical protein